MDDQRGQRLAIGIAVAIVVPQLLTVLLMLAAGVPLGNLGLWFNFLASLAVAVGLIRGAWWARAYGTWVLGLGGLGWAAGALFNGIAGLLIGLPVAAVYFVCTWLLWSSPAIEAFVEGRRAKKDEVLRLERL